jgi:hypothetical protein
VTRHMLQLLLLLLPAARQQQQPGQMLSGSRAGSDSAGQQPHVRVLGPAASSGAGGVRRWRLAPRRSW